jgi:apolipoprotein D and lipocalin family protein
MQCHARQTHCASGPCRSGEFHGGLERYERASDGSIATTFTFNKDSFKGKEKRMTPRGYVGDDPSNAIWIMARTPTIPAADYSRLVEKVRALGYDTSKLMKVPQRSLN